jgi:hypothetical protein
MFSVLVQSGVQAKNKIRPKCVRSADIGYICTKFQVNSTSGYKMCHANGQ